MVDEQTPLMSGGPNPVEVEEESAALKKFRLAVGINTSPSASPSDLKSLRKHSSGIYKAILAQKQRYIVQYQIVSTLYYVALITQLVIGATLAALGPLSKMHPTAITVLGIGNSCLAGLLGMLKSQSLPDRLRKDAYQFRKVQDFIEGCESRLVVGWDDISTKEIDSLIREVFDRYEIARDTAEMNRSDNYAHQVDGDTKDHAQPSNGMVGQQSRIVVGKGKALQIS